MKAVSTRAHPRSSAPRSGPWRKARRGRPGAWSARVVGWAIAIASVSGFGAHAQGVEILATDSGLPVAWWYPENALVLAVGTAEHEAMGVPLARRAAVVDAQRMLLAAVASMQGVPGQPVTGVIRNGRVVFEEADHFAVRVYVVARYADVSLSTRSALKPIRTMKEDSR